MEKLHLNEELFEAWRKPTAEGDIYLVSKNRAPLADLIQKYLIRGEHEWGYIKHPDGTVNPTPLKGAEYEPSQVGVDYDEEDNTYIKISASEKESLNDAIKIADKFKREYFIKDNSKKAGGNPKAKFQLFIKLKDEDWDKPYKNPEDEVYNGKENIEVEESLTIKEDLKPENSKFAKKYPERFEKVKEIYYRLGYELPNGEALDEIAKLLNVNIDESLDPSDIDYKIEDTAKYLWTWDSLGENPVRDFFYKAMNASGAPTEKEARQEAAEIAIKEIEEFYSKLKEKVNEYLENGYKKAIAFIEKAKNK